MDQNIQLKGCRLHITNTNKFKNTLISIKFKNDLKRETSTLRSLLSMVLLGGTKDLPSIQALATYLEEMYGANLSSNVSTKGSSQIIHLTSSFVNENYLVDSEKLFEKQLGLMKDILFNPLFENGMFTSQIIDTKKRELKERLAVLKDDKYTYALDKTLDYMGKDQVLGISGIGYEEDIEKITASDLTEALFHMIKNDTIEVYAVGSFSEDDIELMKETFDFSSREENFDAAICFESPRNSVQSFEEVQTITQAKFNMAFSCDVCFKDEMHEAMTVFNGIFGAFSHSRLFKNVREKHSLCYYVSSNYDAFNGVVMVSCGIDGVKASMVQSLVLEQLVDIQNGNISDEELNITKMMFANSLKKSQDEPGNIVMLKYNRDIVSKKETVDEYLNKLLAVTKEDIIEVSKKMRLDTTYLLKGESVNANH